MSFPSLEFLIAVHRLLVTLMAPLDEIQQLAAYPLAGMEGHHPFSYLLGLGQAISLQVKVRQCYRDNP